MAMSHFFRERQAGRMDPNPGGTQCPPEPAMIFSCIPGCQEFGALYFGMAGEYLRVTNQSI